jgi:hypothetical protein
LQKPSRSIILLNDKSELREFNLQFDSGEVIISPYTIFWIKMPVIIGEPDKLELLKRNLFLVDLNIDCPEYLTLPERKGDSSAFFFNLDRIFGTQKLDKKGELIICAQIIEVIKKLGSERCIVHTTILDPGIRQIFQNEGIIYIEKNFNDKAGVTQIILDLIRPIFSSENKVRRAFVRLNLYPGIRYKIELQKDDTTGKTCPGYLLDISMGGIGLVMVDKGHLESFNLKERVTVKIYTPSALYKVPLALMTRKDPDQLQIGLSFNIEDKSMVKEDTANFIIKAIYKWMKEIIDKHGKFPENEK